MLYTSLNQFGAGISVSRCAGKRLSLPELSEILNNQIISTMKKTLIALFALASIAMSAEFTSNSYLKVDGNVSWNQAGTDKGPKDLFSACAGSSTLGDINGHFTPYQGGSAMPTAQIPIHALGNANGSQLNEKTLALSDLYNATTLDPRVLLVSYSFISRSNTARTTGLQLQVSDSSGAVLGVSDDVAYDTNATTDGVYGVGTFTFSDAITLDSNATYTYTILDSSTGRAHTGSVNYGEFKTNYASNNGFKIDGLSQTSFHPVISIKTQTIPEPATAALSLLALAGLAARRRRK